MTTLRESSSPILNTLLQLLQNIGPNILHSQFLNFVRNVCTTHSQRITIEFDHFIISRHFFSFHKMQINKHLIYFSLFYKDLDCYSMEVCFSLFIDRIIMFNLDLQWLKNHVDIVEDFANFLIQVIKKLPHVVHHCPKEAFVLLFQFGKSIEIHR